MAQVVPVGLPPLAERVTACENTLGTPNASAGLLERVKTVEPQLAQLKEEHEALKQELAEQKLALEGKLESKKLAFAEQPGGGSTEEQLRLADLIAAQGGAGKDRARGAAGANRAAEHSSDSADSDDDSTLSATVSR